MEVVTRFFEKYIIYLLEIMIMLIILWAAIHSIANLISFLCETPIALLTVSQLLSMFSDFLMVLLGFTIMHTVRAYLHSSVVRMDTIFASAILVVVRKVIVIDYSATSYMMIISISILVLALSAAYFCVKHVMKTTNTLQ